MGMFDWLRPGAKADAFGPNPAWGRGSRQGFEAGAHNRRLSSFRPPKVSVNQLLEGAGSDMTARARHLVRNNGYAQNAVDAFTSHLVGAGIKPNPQDAFTDAQRQKVLKLWRTWADECDSEGLTDFYGLERRVGRELMIAGECFVRFRGRRPSDGLSVPLQIQILASEMLDLGHNEDLQDGNTIRNGIEFDRLGKRRAYHFWRTHPGDHPAHPEQATREKSRVPAEDVAHILDPQEAGQIRGVSKFAPAIVKLFMLDAYDDAELERKKTTAYFVGFVRKQEADPFKEDEDETQDGSTGLTPMEPGLLQYLDDGEDITFGQPADVGGTYEMFQYRTLLQISSALGVPYPYLTGDMLKANYSNTRASLVDFRRRMEALQWSVMVHLFCRPVWARFLQTANASGALPLAKFDTKRKDYTYAEWLPPKVEWVDPSKDAKAEVTQIDAGLKSRTQALVERGYDPEQVDNEIAADKAREKKLGLSFASAEGAQGGAPGGGGGDPPDGPENKPKGEGDEDAP